MSYQSPINSQFLTQPSTYQTPDANTQVIINDSAITFATNLSTTPLVASIGIDGITTNNPTGFNLLSPVNFNLNSISNVKGISVDGDYGTAGQVLTADGAEGMSWTDVSGVGTTILPYSRVPPLSPQTSVLSADSSGNIYDLGDAFYIRNFGASIGLFATGSLDLLDGYGGSTTLNTYALDFGTDGQFSCRLSQDGGLRMTSSYNECLGTYSASSIDMNFQNNNVVKLSSVANNQANAGLFLTRVATGLGAYYTDIGVQLGVVPDTGIYTTKLTKDYLKVDKIKDASSNYGTLGQILSSDACGNIVWATGGSSSTPSLQEVLDVSNISITGIYMNGAGIYDTHSHILPNEFKISYIDDVGGSGSNTITEGGFTIINDDGTGTVITQQNATSQITINQYDGITSNTLTMNPFSISVSDGIVGSSLTKIDLTTPNLKATTITDMNASIGLDGQYLVSTGSGLEWSNQLVSNTPIIVPASIGTYTDSQPPSFNVVVFNTVPYDGWFFQNYRTGATVVPSPPLTPYSNIGWNMYLTNGTYPSSIAYNTNSIKQMYVCFLSTVSTCSIGLNVYTSPLYPAPPLIPPAFYKSRLGAILQGATVDISLNKQYIAYYDFSGNTYPAPTKFLHTPLQMMLAPPDAGVQVGAFYGETLNYFSVSSNTISVANADSFIVSEAGFIMEDGTQQPFRQPYLFQSASIQPLTPFSLQQGLNLATTMALTQANVGYTFIVSSGTTLSLTTAGLTSTLTTNGVWSVYNSRSAGNNIVITHRASPLLTYTLLAGKSVSYVWDGAKQVLQLQ